MASQLPWTENWERSYRISIGTRETTQTMYISEGGDILPQFIARPSTEAEVTIPSNARLMSNLLSDNYDRRGFTFRFNSTVKLSSQGSGGENSELELYNPNQDLIDVMAQDGCIVILECGYSQKVSKEYVGDLVSMSSRTQGSDTIYTLKVASGAQAMRNTLVSLHYDETASQRDVIVDLVGRLPGTAIGTYGLSSLGDKYKTGGYSYVGSLISNLDTVLARYNMSYVHTNGLIIITPYRLLGEDYDAFARTNYNLPIDTIKQITDISNRGDNGSGSVQSKVRKVQINTQYIPIQMGQFITIPDTKYTKQYRGTYQVQAKRTILETTPSGGWDVVLEATEI